MVQHLLPLPSFWSNYAVFMVRWRSAGTVGKSRIVNTLVPVNSRLLIPCQLDFKDHLSWQTRVLALETA